MKRLFRTSKSTVDPLPPPPLPAPDYTPQYQPQPHPLGQPSLPPPPPTKPKPEGHDEVKGKGWFSHAPSVTPFPIDAGQAQAPTRRLSRREKREREKRDGPTLAELQAHTHAQSRGMSMDIPRSRGNSNPLTSVSPGRKFYEEDWTPPTKHSPEPYSRHPSPPLPIPVAPAMQGRDSGRSSPTSQGLYLPPGARPPTPPAALRPSTPTRPPFAPSSMGHSSVDEWERTGRDRGYSSASGSMRGSDVESSVSHKQSKPVVNAMKSPLAHAVEPFPTPQPYTYVDDMTRLSLQQAYEPNERPYEDHHPKDVKEKKKFWGMDMGWAGKKEKERPKEDKWRETYPEMQDPAQAPDVAAAIQMLCSNPDPSFNAVYTVCERITHSEQNEGISKDAARALRKQFKHGSEPERNAAAVVWLLMMRNIPVFRPHASSRKFLKEVEPALARPGVISEVVGDLAYNFGHEKGCEGLLELWKKIKPKEDAPRLPDDHLIFQPEPQYPEMTRQPSRERPGPGYASLPSHSDDMRRLIEESMAAKESARVLAEALVFSRPDELDKPIIREFYNKCFHALESLTGQMDWAQAEANQSRERSSTLKLERDHTDTATTTNIEEEALGALFEAHAALDEAIKQHDEMDRMAMEHRELSEVRERSKKDTRMGRNDPARTTLLAVQPASTSRSRSPSPARPASPRIPLDDPPPIASPRPASPRVPRPLPIPGAPSNPNLGSNNPFAQQNGFAVSNPDDPPKPSRKALGKRRALPIDPDDNFDPNDMFGQQKKSETSSSSDESVTADEVFFAKPVTYAYDAYKEKLEMEAGVGGSGGNGSGSGGAVGGSGVRGVRESGKFGGGSASVSVPAG